MQIYLVGGAIRDQLLGYPVVERDWVVVGSCAEELLTAGYQQVGRDFPVFLHPNTKEEYALARVERKQGPGYRGFHCEANPQVRLEDDLRRRDLTINAMAVDDQGQLIDPYHGRTDLQRRQLRHVSDAFQEDPVRVLRVARFMARYAHRQFTVAPETLHVMCEMAKQGELAHLVPERVWQEWHKSLSEKNPEAFLITLEQCHALPIIFPELASLDATPTRLLKSACLLSSDPLIRLAALLFALPHAQAIDTLCTRLRIPQQTVQLAQLLQSTHDAIMHLNQLQAVDVLNVFSTADAFRRPERFEKLLLLCDVLALCYDHEQIYTPVWRQIVQTCRQIKTETWLNTSDPSDLIQKKRHQALMNCIIPLLDFE